MDYEHRTMPITGFFGEIRPSPLFDSQLRPRLSVILGVLLVSLLWVLIAVAASIADGTLQLPEPGRGLLNHYGFQASVLAAPMVLLTVYYAVSYFLRVLRDIDQFVAPGTDISLVYEIVKPHVDSIFLRRIWSGMLGLFIFTGLAVSIAIFTKLNAPRGYWGNDVFNATYYRYGFVAGNLFFLWLWGFVYPVGIFYALHLTLSMGIIVARLKRRNFLRLNFLHIDRCGGMSRFGTLNFIIMLIYVWPSVAIYAFHFTHQFTYLSLIVAAAAISVLLIAQSIYGIYWVSRTISSERKSAIISLNDEIVKAMNGTRRNFAAAGATLQYRDRVLSVKTFPYSRSVETAVNVLRFAPTAFTIVKFFLDRNSVVTI
jgi:hypothetical protein